MGIFSRFKDIVSANLNSILDRAEDPEKMVRLMIQEMEDTLIEVKSSCAAEMAQQKKLERALDEAENFANEWSDKAKLAVAKGRDDLARAALNEKRRYAQRATALRESLEHGKGLVTQFHSDIAELEAKLADARQKQHSIIQRRAAAVSRRDAQVRIRRIDTTEAFAKFAAYENSIDRLEAEGSLVNGLRPKNDLNTEFAQLENQEEIEQDLEQLKKDTQPQAAQLKKEPQPPRESSSRS
jgi:phage shock protein A